MLVTTFYLAMTFINAWRMRSLKSHLLKFMSWKSSAVLYKFSSGVSPLKAKLIIERKVHYITDVIEITEATRMCRLRPIQFIDINRWFSIANGLPLWSNNVFQQPDSTPKLCVFIECEMEPSVEQSQDDVITLESLGQVWAWRADKNLEFIAVIPFNKLLEMCYKFLYGSLIINERLPVTRIQTVYATGMPHQPEDVQINKLKKIIKDAHRTSQEIDWTYYSGVLKHMYREVFINSNKMAKSYITSVPSQILSPPQTHPDSSENNIESNNSNHCDELNHNDRTRELIRALSQEIEPDPNDEADKKSPEEQIKAISDEIEPKTNRDKKPQGLEANHKPNKRLIEAEIQTTSQEIDPETKQESHKKSHQEKIRTLSKETKQEEPNVETIQEQILLPQEIEANHISNKKSTQEQTRVLSQESKPLPNQESNIKSPEGKQRTLQKQKQVQETSRKTKVEESIPKPVKQSKQEINPEPKQEVIKQSDEIELKHQKHDSLKPSQESGSSSRSSTPEILEGTIVRSETVNIRQKLSPSRKRKTNKGNVATTIETTIQSVTTHRRVTSLIPPSQERPSSSVSENTEKRKIDLPKSTALDVLVYSESVVAKNNLIATLKNVLDPERYTIYPVPLSVLRAGAWKGKVAMIAVVGNTGEATPDLLQYFLAGGRLMAICSDLLQAVVPYYRTAEIRENEIVQFSFDKWKAVKLKHHVLCFQASPAKKQFSSESDRHVMEHELFVEVLANEETWRTPSLIQVVENTNHGVSIFSQIHLETNPAEYLGEEGPKFNKSRYEILFKILGDIISLHVKDINEIPTVDYTEGYFFGDEKMVQSYLSELPGPHKKTTINEAEIEWLSPGQSPTHPPSQSHLPVRLAIPKTFCYETYRQNLTSSALGRVVLYADVVGTTMTWCALPLHGLAVVAARQLAGRGRSRNQFISPPGQAILSLQVWQEMNDRISLTQNVAALAAVLAIRSDTPYEALDIRIKWPNDIYYGRDVKIGGVMTTADVMDDKARIYIGIGVNISNSVPTTCVNDIITQHNARHGTALPPVTVEWFVARFCSHMERVLASMATDQGQREFLEEYYKYWLHSKEQISVIDKDGKRVSGTIHGMDRFGFLLVNTSAGQVTVNPDGNSFDLMANLIVAKY